MPGRAVPLMTPQRGPLDRVPLVQQRILFAGAGVGIGAADLIAAALRRQGMPDAEARGHCHADMQPAELVARGHRAQRGARKDAEYRGAEAVAVVSTGVGASRSLIALARSDGIKVFRPG
jgi:hypothetical protein